MTDDYTLRKWCLEQAFKTREINNVPHMQVTNVARDYYRWIVDGESQGCRALASYQEQMAEQSIEPVVSVHGD